MYCFESHTVRPLGGSADRPTGSDDDSLPVKLEDIAADDEPISEQHLDSDSDEMSTMSEEQPNSRSGLNAEDDDDDDVVIIKRLRRTVWLGVANDGSTY